MNLGLDLCPLALTIERAEDHVEVPEEPVAHRDRRERRAGAGVEPLAGPERPRGPPGLGYLERRLHQEVGGLLAGREAREADDEPAELERLASLQRDLALDLATVDVATPIAMRTTPRWTTRPP